jgi:AAA ATPase domain
MPELVLVSGSSGIGKSALVHEAQKALVPIGGLFASGKFDRHKRWASEIFAGKDRDVHGSEIERHSGQAFTPECIIYHPAHRQMRPRLTVHPATKSTAAGRSRKIC